MKVLIAVTGGTFGSNTQDNGFLNVMEKGKLLSQIERLMKKFKDATIDYQVITPFIILSENITPRHWELLIKELLLQVDNKKPDAILIIHGTDTMAYTSSAVSYVERLSKKFPIIFTGASYPITMEKTDAEVNFMQSLYFAKWAVENRIKGTFIVFNGQYKINSEGKIHLGTKVKKDKWEEFCYRSFYIGKDSLGRIINNRVEFDNLLYKDIFPRETKFPNLKIEFRDEKVAGFKIYPGFPTELIEKAFNLGKRLILLEIFNSGTAPTGNNSYSLSKVIRKIREKGGLVFTVSQHEGGKGATMNVYASSNELRKSGLISLNDMIWESALPKLMLAAANFENNKEIEKFMKTNIAGEITH